MALNSFDYSGKSEYSNLCDEYSATFEYYKGIPPVYDIKHHID